MAGTPEDERRWIRPRQEPMVGWYDPRQLFRTGVELMFSEILSKRADYRQLLTGPPTGLDMDLSWRDQAPLWIDFTADTGDGFNSTCSVARALAHPVELPGRPEALPAGELVVLGGDAVYPTPHDRAYDRRLLNPYSRCMRKAEREASERTLFALPGNHDWYDGLFEFTKVFCRGERIGPWNTRQCRSYFAVRLPYRFWVLGVDLQVEHDIDLRQLDYFLSLEIPEGDKVILVTPEPHWETHWTPDASRRNLYDPDLGYALGRLMRTLEARGVEIPLQLSGDLHHYRRYSHDAHSHLLTVGGGGAFLHPTHTLVDEPVKLGNPRAEAPLREYGKHTGGRYHAHANFPSPSTSRGLAVRNLWFGARNPYFALTLGVAYALLGLVMPNPQADPTGRSFLVDGLLALVERPGACAFAALIAFGFWAFTDTSQRWYRLVAGGTHAGAHLFSSLVSAWLSVRWVLPALFRRWPDLSTDGTRILTEGVVVAGCFVGGLVFGSFVWGLYLWISVVIFKRHTNEAFSSLKIEDYKCILRMQLTREKLSIYPLGLARVPRKWKLDAHTDEYQPSDAGHRRPEYEWALVDEVLTIPAARERDRGTGTARGEDAALTQS